MHQLSARESVMANAWCWDSSSVVRSNKALPSVASVALPDDEAGKDQEEQEDSAAERASWSRERSIAEALVGKLMQQWQGPIATLSRAGKAFEGLEALLGGAQGGGFDLGVSAVLHLLCVFVNRSLNRMKC